MTDDLDYDVVQEIAEDEIRRYIHTHLRIAEASPPDDPTEVLRQVRHLHLAEPWLPATAIRNRLRDAGLLTQPGEPSCGIKVGDVIHGYAFGIFGRDHYECSRVEAIGSDWVVVRTIEDGIPRFSSGGIDTYLLASRVTPCMHEDRCPA